MYKSNTELIVIDAKATEPISTNVVFWSHDKGTAKMIFELQKNHVDQSLATGTKVPILLEFDSATAENGRGKHTYFATIDDAVNGIVSIILEDNILGYQGRVDGSIYIELPDSRSLDTAGRFTFHIKRCPIDEDVPELEDYYWQGFSEIMEQYNESIAEIKSEAKELLDSLTADVTTAQNKVTTLEQSITTANTNLNARIDEINKKIDDNDVFTKAESSANVIYHVDQLEGKIDTKLANKADKTQVTKVEDMISKMPSATPKETFASLAALQAKYPTGNTSAMVVLEADGVTGYVYLWNGTAWQKGALYQAQGIADSTVTATKISAAAGDGLSFVKSQKSANIFDYQDSRIREGFINGSKYTEKHASLYLEISYPIFLEKGTVCFTIPRGANLTVWHTDVDGAYIDYVTGSNDTSNAFAKVDLPARGYYVFNLGEQTDSVPAKKKDRFMISYNYYPEKYVEYKSELSNEVRVTNDVIEGLKVGLDEREVLDDPINYFDVSDEREKNIYLGLNGYYTQSDASYQITNPIYLKAGVYRCPFLAGYQDNYYCIESTRNGRFLNSILAVIENKIAKFEIKENGYYRFNFRSGLTSSQNFMIVKDINYPSEFEPYKRMLNKNVLINEDNLNFSVKQSSNVLTGKTWVAAGDSVTVGLKGELDDAGELKNYQYYIGKRNDMKIITNAISGSTLTNISGKNPFSVSGRYDALGTNIDYLTIWFGINDSAYAELGTVNDSTNTTFFGAWNVVMEYLITTYPKTKIGLIVTFNGSSTFREAVRTISKKWGVSYLDFMGDPQVPLISGRETGFGLSDVAKNIRRETFLADGTHPNDVGYQYISTIIEDFLRRL